MAEVSIDGHACLKTMCFTGFDFRDGFAGLGYPMNVTELYWLQVNIGLGNGLCRQAKSYISAAYADRQSSFCLAIQYTRRFCAQGDSMPHRCLATGRWGAARGRPDTGNMTSVLHVNPFLQLSSSIKMVTCEILLFSVVLLSLLWLWF